MSTTLQEVDEDKGEKLKPFTDETIQDGVQKMKGAIQSPTASG
jgi:hypothetical protein